MMHARDNNPEPSRRDDGEAASRHEFMLVRRTGNGEEVTLEPLPSTIQTDGNVAILHFSDDDLHDEGQPADEAPGERPPWLTSAVAPAGRVTR